MRPWVQSLGEEGKNVGGGGEEEQRKGVRGERERTQTVWSTSGYHYNLPHFKRTLAHCLEELSGVCELPSLNPEEHVTS